MREIKFRAWDREAIKMIYNVEMGFNMGSCFGDVLDEVDKGKMILMQYTKLKDENGNEIYEGDVIEINKTARPDFIWLDKPFVVEIPDIYRLFERHVLGNEVKIIGNIHENPELLKED